jgi:flagellar biosynthesis/type III secretory pathway protein FliH
MGPIAHPARGGGAAQTLVLRKATVAAQAVPVGAARKAAAVVNVPVEDAAPADRTVGGTVPAEGASATDRAAEIEAVREQALEQARELGYAEGLSRGDEEAKRELAQRRSEFERLVASMEKAHQEALAGTEDMALGIAWEAVCKILGEAAVTRPGIQALVEQTASRVRAEEKMVVRLCPSDIGILKEGRDPSEAGDEPRRLEFLADASIEMGGCIIETSAGRIDAKLETQLSRLSQTLLAVRLARKEARP